MKTILSMQWRSPDVPLILASQSPRRAEILNRLGLTFSITPPRVDNEQTFFKGTTVVRGIKKLALEKAKSIAAENPRALVLGADTVVVYKGVIFGKPDSRTHAKKMLTQLSGAKHTVYSGVALVCGDQTFSACTSAATDVYFRTLSGEEVEEYLDTQEYTDKAGAYAIQGGAMAFVEKIHGCYNNVVGLPVTATIGLLNDYATRKDLQ